MRLLIAFARKYPVTSTVMVLALLLAGLMEGIGLSMLLPLIGLTITNPGGGASLPDAQNAAADSTLERIVREGFNYLGITPTLGVLLIIIIVTVILVYSVNSFNKE